VTTVSWRKAIREGNRDLICSKLLENLQVDGPRLRHLKLLAFDVVSFERGTAGCSWVVRVLTAI
jgi:hypothetical protein